VRGDAIRLEQVLINLLRNALDAMADKPRKRLEIRLHADEQLWRLSVSDSGGGIAEEHLANVFDPSSPPSRWATAWAWAWRFPTLSCTNWAGA
jgi:C4-dicarboxylate-specific signal transduction histidine kinase